MVGLQTLQSLFLNQEDQSHGMVIKGYHTDNRIVNNSKFMKKLLKNQIKIRFRGPGASHQNGSADLTINILVNMARSMLMHAVLRRPKNTLYTYF